MRNGRHDVGAYDKLRLGTVSFICRDDGSMRYADDHEFFSSWSYEDFTDYMPLPTPPTNAEKATVQTNEESSVVQTEIDTK